MTTQMFLVILGIFVLGLVLGSNLGVILMCLLHMSAESEVASRELLSVSVQTENYTANQAASFRQG